MGQMTRRDYELVGETIKHSKNMLPIVTRQAIPADAAEKFAAIGFDIQHMSRELVDATADFIAGELAKAFAEQNKAFDAYRFMEDCGAQIPGADDA